MCSVMRLRRRSALLVLIFVSAACGGTYQTPTAPTPPPRASAPTQPVVPASQPVVNWLADATTTAAVYGDGGPCGWGTAIGDTRKGVFWNIRIEGSSISMDEDLPNWPTDDVPFAGVLNGNEFKVEYFNGPDYLGYVCRWRGATLSGRFSDDRSTFEAIENVFWGTPEGGTTITRQWSGHAVR